VPKIIGVLALLFASSLAAQQLTVGVHPPEPLTTATLSSTAAPVSYVNLLDFATAAGTVNKASVDWSFACSNAFKIVFLRASVGSFGPPTSFTVVATRGPFNAVVGRNDVTLSPPVTLAQGDLIGIVQLQPYTACGSVRLMDYGSNNGYTLISVSDVSTSGAIGSSSNFGPGYRISAVAYASDPLLVRVLPAVGATQGVGAFFRTALQLYNPSGSTITGNLVFHKQGVPGTSGDPSLAFTLVSGQVKSYPDVITTMGASGIGSLDVFTNGGAVPVAAARLFADGGTAGTAGFSEEGLPPADAIDTFRRGVLLTPEDPVNFRMNIGVRTLDSGATISILLLDANSNFLGSRTATYAANYFEQVPFAAFTGVSTIPAGGRIQISVTYPGTIFIYSSVIDNRTSDSTFRMADIK
jgi:hypothetical protein